MRASPFIAAAVTLRSGVSLKKNVDHVVPLLREAIEAGATYIQTPEMTSIIERDRVKMAEQVGAEAEDAVVMAARELAAKHKVAIHIGSVPVKLPEKFANRGLLIDPDGEIVARYDKIHLFDVDLPSGQTIRESNSYVYGADAVLVDMPWGGLGMTICYDMRFPYLYRALAEAGADLLTAPANFTKETGEAHWHILLRCRAIENGAFMIAAAQGGLHEDGRQSYGHSLIIDPWGRILAESGIEPGVILAKIDPAEVALARGRIPTHRHTRPTPVVRAGARSAGRAAAE